MGPETANAAYTPWTTQNPAGLCPSDGAPVTGIADSNYAANWGDNGNGNHVPGTNNANRGVFGRRVWRGIRDLRDGTTSTLLLGEIGRSDGGRTFVGNALVNSATLPSACLTAAQDVNNPSFYAAGTLVKRGDRYSDGAVTFTGFNTMSPPNGPSCVSVDPGDTTVAAGAGVLTAGSYHSGGAQVTMGDGSVKFISETINAGTQSGPLRTSGQSNFGTWGALGTRAGGEVKTDF